MYHNVPRCVFFLLFDRQDTVCKNPVVCLSFNPMQISWLFFCTSPLRATAYKVWSAREALQCCCPPLYPHVCFSLGVLLTQTPSEVGPSQSSSASNLTFHFNRPQISIIVAGTGIVCLMLSISPWWFHSRWGNKEPVKLHLAPIRGCECFCMILLWLFLSQQTFFIMLVYKTLTKKLP